MNEEYEKKFFDKHNSATRCNIREIVYNKILEILEENKATPLDFMQIFVNIIIGVYIDKIKNPKYRKKIFIKEIECVWDQLYTEIEELEKDV